jgi:hypothetical protein
MKRSISAILAAVLLLCSLTACSSDTGAKLTSEELAAIINENGSEMTEYNPAAALDSDDENLATFMQWQEWDKANFEVGAFSFSLMNVQAYTIAIVKPAEGQKDTVLKYFADYQQQTENNFDKYLVDQYDIAKSAVTEEVNGYVVFVMAENAGSIAESIKAKL